MTSTATWWSRIAASNTSPCSSAPAAVTSAGRIDYSVGTAPSGIAIQDVSGDGFADLVVTNSGDATVSVLLGNGAGGFAPATTFTTGLAPRAVAIGDLNGDTKPDLGVANFDAASVSVLLGDGTGGFGAKSDFATGPNPSSLVIGELSGDAIPDIAVANRSYTLPYRLQWRRRERQHRHVRGSGLERAVREGLPSARHRELGAACRRATASSSWCRRRDRTTAS